MVGIKNYIVKIGKEVDNWLENFKHHFVKDYQPDLTDAAHREPTLFLLSGTIESILEICDTKFLTEMLVKLVPVLHL